MLYKRQQIAHSTAAGTVECAENTFDNGEQASQRFVQQSDIQPKT